MSVRLPINTLLQVGAATSTVRATLRQSETEAHSLPASILGQEQNSYLCSWKGSELIFFSKEQRKQMFKKYSSVFARLQNETPFSAVTFRQTHHKLEMSEIKHVLDRPVFRTLAQQHSTQWKTAFSLQIPGLNRVVAAHSHLPASKRKSNHRSLARGLLQFRGRRSTAPV